MKIEKLNERQIRCTLTRQDLETRSIKLSELAYGSEKTKFLFRDMMQQASEDFGFEVDDMPLMIEAIPVSQDSIVLIISKVDSPDELDSRFSNFTQSLDLNDESSDYSEEPGKENTPNEDDEPSDLIDLVERLRAEREKQAHAHSAATESASRQNGPEKIKLYSFSDLDPAISLAHRLEEFYRGENNLFRDPATAKYYLSLRQGSHSTEEFTRVCHMAAQFLHNEPVSVGTEEYLREHMNVVIPENAIQILSTI